MKALILLLLLLPCTLFAQQLSKESERWLNKSLNDSLVDKKELKADFTKYDFSSLWLAHQDACMGYIGENFQRFYIHFLEIVKDSSNPSSYWVKGKSRVGNNICDFEGRILILHIKEIDKHERETFLKIAEQQKDTGLLRKTKPQKYIVLTEYTFKENTNQWGTGIFRGIMKSIFYIKNNKVTFDDLDYGDSYYNNAAVGTWKSYKSEVMKVCNWGEFKIPYSDSLGGGAAEFYIYKKYRKYGWENYYKAWFERDKNAQKEEEKKWWK